MRRPIAGLIALFVLAVGLGAAAGFVLFEPDTAGDAPVVDRPATSWVTPTTTGVPARAPTTQTTRPEVTTTAVPRSAPPATDDEDESEKRDERRSQRGEGRGRS